MRIAPGVLALCVCLGAGCPGDQVEVPADTAVADTGGAPDTTAAPDTGVAADTGAPPDTAEDTAPAADTAAEDTLSASDTEELDGAGDAGPDAGCTREEDCPSAGLAACRVPACDGGQCGDRPAPDGASCDDGTVCTAADRCEAGLCRGGPAPACDDGDPCTADHCDATVGCAHAPLDGACDDGNPCTDGDVCAEAQCQPGTGVCVCESDGDCLEYDDGDVCNGELRCIANGCVVDPATVPDCAREELDACQVATCDPTTGACGVAAVEDGTPCSGADLCETGSCQSGACVDLAPVACAASDACHLAGSCDPATGACSDPAAPDATPCDDGDACTQADACSAGACVGADPIVCAAKDDCHLAGACDPATGACSDPAAADDASCDDGDPCTTDDACQSGACVGAAVVCHASDACHLAGTCDAETGLCSNPAADDEAACDDGDACTGSSSCQAGSCVGADPVVCQASDACHVAGSCDPETGLCSDPVAPDATACDDGDACTGSSSCQGGACVGAAPVVCQASDACHLAGTCDPATGECSDPVADAATPCDDHDACTTVDGCQGGTCVGGGAVVCFAKDACHVAGSCDPATGQCGDPAAADGGTCDDANPCTADDQCQGGVCVGTPGTCACDVGDPDACAPYDDEDRCNGHLACVEGVCVIDPDAIVICAASDACHDVGVCDPATGQCSDPKSADGTTCQDGDACTADDTCQDGACAPGTPLSCPAPPTCHAVGACDPATGACSDPTPLTGPSCDDGDACTLGDACDAGACVPTGAVTCVALDACHDAGVCSPATGACSNPVAEDGRSCDDGDRCTNTDTCQGGVCTGAAPTVCEASCVPGQPCLTDGYAYAELPDCSSYCYLDDEHAPVQLVSQGKLTDGVRGTDDVLGDIGDGSRWQPWVGWLEGQVHLTFQFPAVRSFTSVSVGVGNQCCGVVQPSQIAVSFSQDGAQFGPELVFPLAAGTVAVGTRGDVRLDLQGAQAKAIRLRLTSGGEFLFLDEVSFGPPVGVNECLVGGTCDPATGTCTPDRRPDGTVCDDHDACTLDDACADGDCGGTPVICSPLDQCHDAGTCDPASGDCSNPPSADGSTCDDGDPCTLADRCDGGTCAGTPVVCQPLDQCHLAGECDAASGTCSSPEKTDDSTCDDGSACTQIDTCQGGACVGASPVVCAAADDCHLAGACDPATGTCSSPVADDGTGCDDGDNCTTDDVCNAGGCAGTAVVCAASDQCHLAGVCDPATGACSDPPVDDGTPCDDASVCTDPDTCQGGVCQGEAVITCEASDQCHDAGTCDPVSGACSDPPSRVGSYCEDGDPCTLFGTCDGAGGCVGDTPATCAVGCTPGLDCDPSRYDLVTLPDCAAGCLPDDPHPSDVGFYPGQLTDGVVGDGPLDEDLGDGPGYAWVGWPGPEVTVVFLFPTERDFSTLTLNLFAATADDVPTTVTVDFSASLPAYDQAVTFSAALGNLPPVEVGQPSAISLVLGARHGRYVRVHATLPAAAHLYLGEVAFGPPPPPASLCYTMACDSAAGGCVPVPRDDGSPCDDGDACTTVDSCAAGRCVGASPVACAAPDSCHAAGTCDPATGACHNPALADYAPCDDGDGCTRDDYCLGGACDHVDQVFCDYPTSDCLMKAGCDEATGECLYAPVPNGGPCYDGDECTANDSCQDGACTGAPLDCSTTDPCLVSYGCDATLGCMIDIAEEYAPCDDGDPCTRDDYCAGGICTGDNPVECVASDSCHVTQCDAFGGCTPEVAKADGMPCSDDDRCTIYDHCEAGVCVATEPFPCDPAPPCHEGPTCDPLLGCQTPPSPDGTSCDDDDPCTVDDACTAGSCGGTPVADGTACEDPFLCTVGDTCQAGSCHSGPQKVCQLPSSCWAWTAPAGNRVCDYQTGACPMAPVADGTSCWDGDACTYGDTCQGGQCGGTAVVCAKIGQCYDPAGCDSATGGCVQVPSPDGTACDDGYSGTRLDLCQSGACVGQDVVLCEDYCGTLPELCQLVGYALSSDGGAPIAPDETFGVGDDGVHGDGQLFDGVRGDDGFGDGAAWVGYDGPFTVTIRMGFRDFDRVVVGVLNDPDNGAYPPQHVEVAIARYYPVFTTVAELDTLDGSLPAPPAAPARADIPLQVGYHTARYVRLTFSGAAGPVLLDELDVPLLPSPVPVCHERGTWDTAADACAYPLSNNGEACDDGDLCTIQDSCHVGSCGGSPVVCAPLDQCHLAGSCDGATGQCSNPAKADDTPCDDGLRCTVQDSCQAGACAAGAPVVCAPPDQCHDDGACDPASGACAYPAKPDATPCDDGLSTTLVDTCAAGRCVGRYAGCQGYPILAADIGPAGGVVEQVGYGLLMGTRLALPAGALAELTHVVIALAYYDPPPPPDGATRVGDYVELQPCGLALGAEAELTLAYSPDWLGGRALTDVVVARDFPGGRELLVPDFLDPVTRTLRVKIRHLSLYTAYAWDSRPTAPAECAADVDCNDYDLCTRDVCDVGTGTCSHPPATTCTALDPCHVAGVCAPETGLCTNPNAADDSGCDDGDLCTARDVCISGVCTGLDPHVCTALDACHLAGSCDPGTGTCDDPVAADQTPCEDGDVCTTGDRCAEGACVPGDPVVCAALDQCHVAGVCVSEGGLGCTHPNAPNTTPCDDGDICTESAFCTEGECVQSEQISCVASDPCHRPGVCVAGVGCTDPARAEGELCDDGDPCTVPGSCQAGACVGQAPVVCSARDACHVAGECNRATGVCGDPQAPNGAPCDDGDPCTEPAECAAGVCGAASPKLCGFDPAAPDPTYAWDVSSDCGSVCYDDAPHHAAAGAFTSFGPGLMTDGQRGGGLTDGRWVGFFDKDVSLVLALPAQRPLTTLTLGLGNQTASGVAQPTEVRVEIKDDGAADYRPAKVFKLADGTMQPIPAGGRGDVVLDLGGEAGRGLRISLLRNASAWVFLDEIEVGDACEVGACDGATGACSSVALADGTACGGPGDTCRAGACTSCSARGETDCAGTCVDLRTPGGAQAARQSCFAPPTSPCQSVVDCQSYPWVAPACVNGQCVYGPVACDGPDPDACEDGRLLPDGSCQDTGPELLWDFEPGAQVFLDDSGHGNHGAPAGGTPVAGPFGGSDMALAASNQHTVARDMTAPATDFTLSGWFATTSPGGGLFAATAAGAIGAVGTKTDREIYLSGGALAYYVDAGTSAACVSTAAVNDGQWHFTALTCDAIAGCRLYLDGAELCASASGEGRSRLTGQNRLVVGWSGRGGYFDGAVDQVALFAHAMTASEVAAIGVDLTAPLQGVNQPTCDGVDHACSGVVDTVCDDGDRCTPNDRCAGPVCLGGAVPACTQPAQCGTASCDPLTGACVTAATPGVACSDNNSCTTVDVCSAVAGVCLGSPPAGQSCDNGFILGPVNYQAYEDAGLVNVDTIAVPSPACTLGTDCDTLIYRIPAKDGAPAQKWLIRTRNGPDPNDPDSGAWTYQGWTASPDRPGVFHTEGPAAFLAVNFDYDPNDFGSVRWIPYPFVLTSFDVDLNTEPFTAGGQLCALPWPQNNLPQGMRLQVMCGGGGIQTGRALRFLDAPLDDERSYVYLSALLGVDIRIPGLPPLPLGASAQLVVDPGDGMFYIKMPNPDPNSPILGGAVGWSTNGHLMHTSKLGLWDGTPLPLGTRLVDAINAPHVQPVVNPAHFYAFLSTEYRPFAQPWLRIGLDGKVSAHFAQADVKSTSLPWDAIVGNAAFSDVPANDDYRILIDAMLTLNLAPASFKILGRQQRIKIPLADASAFIEVGTRHTEVALRGKTFQPPWGAIPGLESLGQIPPFNTGLDVALFFNNTDTSCATCTDEHTSWGLHADIAFPLFARWPFVGAFEITGGATAGATRVALDGRLSLGRVQALSDAPNVYLDLGTIDLSLTYDGEKFCAGSYTNAGRTVTDEHGQAQDTTCAVKVCISNDKTNPFKGTQMACQPFCIYDGECGSGEACNYGICGPKSPNGGVCSQDSACQSGVCYLGFCTECWPKGPNTCGGGFCTDAGYCQAKLDGGQSCYSARAVSGVDAWCKSGSCGDPAWTCRECNVAGRPDLVCAASEYCDASDNRCHAKLGIGEHCGVVGGVDDGRCSSGACDLYCFDYASKDVGEQCAINSYLIGGMCKSKVCVADGAGGGTCRCNFDDGNCASGEFCDGLGFCQDKLSNGTFCGFSNVDDHKCDSGACDIYCYTWRGGTHYGDSCRVNGHDINGACASNQCLASGGCGCNGNDSYCGSGDFCTGIGTCEARLGPGAFCSRDRQCASSAGCRGAAPLTVCGCNGDEQCAAGSFCDVHDWGWSGTGLCKAKLLPSGECHRGGECTSGYCDWSDFWGRNACR